MYVLTKIFEIFTQSGYGSLTWGNVLMLVIGAVLLYLAIVKKFEPLLLLPIAFGSILVNLPLSGIMEEHGFLYYLHFGTKHELFPILIFMGVGAMTDFGPLLANPITLLLGAAAQGGVFVAMLGAVALGFPLKAASAMELSAARMDRPPFIWRRKCRPNTWERLQWHLIPICHCVL